MKTLMDMYQDLKEAHSTSDFPNLLLNTMYKVLLQKFKGVNSPWRSYTDKSDLNDFRVNHRVLMDEAPDLEEVSENGEYKAFTLGDHKYDIQLRTFGRTFHVGRKTIINDDLKGLTTIPGKMGRAAARTLAKQIIAMIESDGNTYDGKSLFHTDHANTSNIALTNDAAGIAAVSAASTAIQKATDETGEKMGLTAKYLLVGPDLEDVALRIVRGTDIVPVSTSGGTRATGKAQRLSVLVDPFMLSTTGWYVMADPSECPVIEVGFLGGKETPDLLLKRADTVSLAGGEDRWGYDFDEISYKIRHDWAKARGYYQGIFRGKA